jgi:hypothetical protein
LKSTLGGNVLAQLAMVKPGKANQNASASPYLRLRIAFWSLGIALALFQTWNSRYFATTDGVSYMDMSDGVLRGQDWHRLINGVWSPLYPALLGLFRRILSPTAAQEMTFDHIVNIPIFLLAFASFEFLLRTVDREFLSPTSSDRVSLPRWAFLTLAYSLFLWASISAISLITLRPDMLMSAFVYLALALVIRMRGRRSDLRSYLVLGAVLGVSFLAKAPMLPIGMLILATSVLIVTDWRRAIPMAACAAAVLLVIGSLYFLPLSHSVGRFTLGESGTFNYILYADHASPTWYLTNPGKAKGIAVHRVRQILDDPATYEFSIGMPVTHPLRFDPSYWTQGLKPVFNLHGQLAAIRENLPLIKPIVIELAGMTLGFVALYSFSGAGSPRVRDLIEGWPLWLVGVAGLTMYAVIHIEARYVGAFLVLFWMGLLVSLRSWNKHPKVFTPLVLAISASLLLAAAHTAYAPRHFRWNTRQNVDAKVAEALANVGTHPGDPVARITTGGFLGWARAAGVTIISEVDLEKGAVSFWKSDPATQAKVLQALRQTGAKSVVGHVWDDAAAPGWYRVGNTHYWIFPLNNLGM